VATRSTRGRRAPEPEARQRDGERTRRALLDAALANFAAKGRAGARLSDIAARAGVNQQLISYYFGGKDGLYDAILEQWHRREQHWEHENLPLPELVMRYLHATLAEPDLSRLFLRELLDAERGRSTLRTTDGEPVEIADFRRRQAAGELDRELDPVLVLVMLQAAVAAPVLFGADVRDRVGLDLRSDEFAERYSRLLRRVVDGLAEHE